MDKSETSVLIVDDDPDISDLMRALLEHAGFSVTTVNAASEIDTHIKNTPPGLIILDIMMPGSDGLEVCQRLRSNPELSDTKIVIVSAKSYGYDKRQALTVGANGYIVKPIDTENFVSQITRYVSGDVTLSFWGVRGTLPVCGNDYLRYGGATNCISASFVDGTRLIFDAGTGIKKLSDQLEKESARLTATILISHPHWDHINALPFFAPLYKQGNTFDIMGPATAAKSIEQVVSAQMDDVYSPITVEEFGAHVRYRDLREETFNLGEIHMSTMLLSHPGNCLGYRAHYHGRSLCYITDNELFLPSHSLHNKNYVSKLTDFVQGTDVLITDSTYTDEQYLSKVGWGHSPLSQVADLAIAANVKTLCLHHHDPGQTDSDIDEKLNHVNEVISKSSASVNCIAPHEGMTLTI